MKPLLPGQPYSERWFVRFAEQQGITIEEARNLVNKAQRFDPYKNAGPHPFFKIIFDGNEIDKVEWQDEAIMELAIKYLTGEPPGIIYWKVLFDDEQPEVSA